ncbi:MAG: GHKL domain-containing protein [Bacteroidetes bacterium]|nr:GHKL domain-containing protein [Bacteroidota bacterium]MBU1115516.1 GHKL domain-containing protein [Bacteroidota bacterium]MBU1799568.1 GHKL domain-containing protein [Bacteroidota bacterium]
MKNFRINIIARILLLTISIIAATFLFFNYGIDIWFILTLLIIVAEIVFLISYVDKTNNELANFLESINYSDFTLHYDYSKIGKSFEKISIQFNKVLEKFKETRNEKEESLKYLQTVIQHIGVGLLSFDSNGEVEFINRAFKKILKINSLKNISALNSISPNLGDFIKDMSVRKKVNYKLISSGETTQLLINATDFRMRGQLYRLVALQNIQSEIEETEIEAWQKIIRVLTHEIMNSITPISSLASTLKSLLDEMKEPNAETIEDLSSAVNTIKKRSEGLMSFVDKYRSITKIPKPNRHNFSVTSLFNRIKILLDSALVGKNIQFHYDVNPINLEINADSDLIEQVLINMLNNAIQSLSETDNGSITLSAYIDNNSHAVLKISDNGAGISDENMERIFVPFYTTKKEGSGIGLSLSQQIIRAHGGRIHVTSKPNKETVFTIKL